MSKWFKSLPDNVHEAIAQHLFTTVECESDCYIHSIRDNKYFETLLHYAKDGPAELWAVVRAMSFTLAPSCWRTQIVVEWLSICASELLELNMLEAPRNLTFPENDPLPHFPRLRKASVHATTDLLSVIGGSPNLSHLTVDITGYQYLRDLVLTVRSLPLKILDICFGGQLKLPSENELLVLFEACPAIEYLNMRGFVSFTNPAWDVITGLRSLKRIGLHTEISDYQLSFLQTMSEVEFTDLTTMDLQKAQSLNTCVTGLLKIFMVPREHIREFKSFSNLRRLSITLCRSDEETLVGVIDNLEELSLSWSCFDYVSYFLGPSRGCRTYPVYYEPDPAVLEDILRSTPRLKSFKIQGVVLRAKVVEKILEIVGGKLENLEVCFDWQQELTTPRMELVLSAVARRCPNLRTLRFLEETSLQDVPIIATKEQRESCMKALRRISEAAPNFMSFRNIRHIIQERFTDIPPLDILVWDDIVNCL